MAILIFFHMVLMARPAAADSMPTSATGNNSSSHIVCMMGGGSHRHAGFTLIEILLVIVIMSVVTAMIAPSYFSVAVPSLEQQGRRLAQLLRLAAEETALEGRPMRWSARAHGYGFERIDAAGSWLLLRDHPFESFSLPAGISIADVQPVDVMNARQSTSKRDEEPVFAHLTLMPEGIVKPASIVLADREGKQLTIVLRPGPAGIALDDGQLQ
ncbi:type II secretion system protein GspH [Mariprofundus erugo]|nr:type II secretion system protein GspH [Mariprofundus erugo]